MLLYCSIQRNDFVLVNIYAPNTEPEQVMFFKHVANALKSLNYESTANIVVGGDFNCCMTDFDTEGGNYKPKNKSISFMESFWDEFDLYLYRDVWTIISSPVLYNLLLLRQI